MIEVETCLDKLFPIDAAAVRKAIESHLEEVAAAPVRSFAPILDFVVGQTVERLKAALHVDLLDVAGEAASALIELRDYRGPDKPPGGASAVLTFDHHVLTAPQVIRVRLELDGATLPPLELVLDLRLVFDALAVTVQAGRVRALGLGPGHAEAALRHKDRVLLPALPTPPLTLPPKRFDPGFAIP
jgi:hypothetical protein